ncbi:uncharacterized protein J3D65DRAFT_370534 [Phyllosticta citribraziliensis]|uniref:Uncharacterized protein n=1 Tax=Phyllosticta citribraziliensis TaxID=989973 RepID=A0ABR1LTR7_9PEZI
MGSIDIVTRKTATTHTEATIPPLFQDNPFKTMAMHRGPAISVLLALAAIFLGTKVFGAPTGEDTQNVHLEARDTPQAGPNFEAAQDKPLLAPRAPVPNAEAEAWERGPCSSKEKRDANADAEAEPMEGPSCGGVGHRRRTLENAAAPNPNKHLEIRDALGPGVDAEAVPDKPLLVPRAPAPEADADADAEADAEAWDDPNCHKKRDADPEAAWSHPSCGVGHRKRMLKRDADADPDSLHDDLAERVQGGLDHQLLARTPPSNARPARKSWARRSMQMGQEQ